MQFVKDFIAGSIILVGKATATLLIWATVLFAMGSGLALLIRGVYWLRFHHWITSICDGHLRYLEHNPNLLGNDQAFLCVSGHAGWTGVDRLINWSFLKGDMSLVLMLLGMVSFGVLIGSTLILNRVPPDNFIRNHYEHNEGGYGWVVIGWMFVIAIYTIHASNF
jgi:hypothetical protein